MDTSTTSTSDLPLASVTGIRAKLVGIKLASTFTGFCAFHDHQVFAPIENSPLASTREHAFLLSYRAVCRELFMKHRARELVPHLKTLDRSKDIAEQRAIQSVLQPYGEGLAFGLRRLADYKSKHDEVLLNQDYSHAHYYFITLSRVPDVLCSGAVTPEYDFNGRCACGIDQCPGHRVLRYHDQEG